MRYLGIDVHLNTSTWCLLDEAGEVLDRGRVETTIPAIQAICRVQLEVDTLTVGQEVGGMAYLVHDAVAGTEARLLSFNAQQMRMIAASRKKTDRRDAYWIARALQTGMHPHPVYLPTGRIRELRALLARRRGIRTDRNRWQVRARSVLRGSGWKIPRGGFSFGQTLGALLETPTGVDTYVLEMLELCQRQVASLGGELVRVDRSLREATRGIDAIRRLQTLPGVGRLVATTIYASVGDIRRFPDARSLCAYAGLVPSVRQSGETQVLGRITKIGSKALRGMLVQAAHVLMGQCRRDEAKPLQELGLRIQGSRGRKKIATVAVARHLLRIAYYILRDETVYDSSRLRQDPPLVHHAA